MKKIIATLMIFSLLLTGCGSSAKKTSEIKILTPNGAPSLSLLSVYKDIDENGEIKIVEGSDLISSELVKDDSSYDVIVAPINLGCKLLENQKTDYKLAGVITWGNLYLVENPAVKTDTIAAFGEQAVPGLIFNLVKDSSDLMKDKEVTFYNAVSDVQPQIIQGKAHYALMAEPAATATIAKAKQNNVTLKIVADLQEIYQAQAKTSELGYPQAAIFVKNKADVQNFLNDIDTFTNTDALKEDNQIAALVEEIGAETFGVPSAEIVAKTWTNQNIHYKDAQEVKDDIEAILKQFGITYSDDMLAS